MAQDLAHGARLASKKAKLPRAALAKRWELEIPNSKPKKLSRRLEQPVPILR
jgi:hypothetical protein